MKVENLKKIGSFKAADDGQQMAIMSNSEALYSCEK